MQTYRVELESPIYESFRCQKACNSVDLDIKKKSKHNLEIQCDLNGEWNVGMIVGASGSGKTTLARQMFKYDFETPILNEKIPIIEQFVDSFSYDDCVNYLNGIGLSQVPCWVRPVYTLSNGQKARAEAALRISQLTEINVLDEWTSVVDRTTAKAMSVCVSKVARRQNKKIILLSCHFDIIDWVDPDWVIDCNTQSWIDRRLLQQNERTRKEQLQFDIKEIDGKSWKYFSKYHYLNERLPGGKNYFFGLFHNNKQIGFQTFSNYTPTRHNKQPIYHSNRTVIHPDYVGLGLGIKIINITSDIMHKRGFIVMAKFTSLPVYKAMQKQKCWILKNTGYLTQCGGGQYDARHGVPQ